MTLELYSTKMQVGRETKDIYSVYLDGYRIAGPPVTGEACARLKIKPKHIQAALDGSREEWRPNK